MAVEVSFFSQIVSASKENISDAKLVTKSKVSGADFNEDNSEYLDIFNALATKADERHAEQNITKKKSSTDAKKRANISNKIFGYIHVAHCQPLFFWLGMTI